MRRAHDGTQGLTYISLRDEEGNIETTKVIEFKILKLTPECFLLALQKILDERDMWEEEERLKREAPLGLGRSQEP